MPNKDFLARIIGYTAKPALLIAICVSVSYLLAGKISSISQAMIASKTNNAILERRVETIRSLKTDFATITDEKYDAVINALPTTDQVVEIGLALDRLASTNNVTLTRSFGGLSTTDIDIQDPQRPLATISLSMNLSATISQFNRFIIALEKMPYFISIQNIYITGNSKLGWDGSSNIAITAKVYLKKISL